MKIQLVRHATLWIEYGGHTFLVDPMFSDTGANPPIMNSGNERRNPLLPLPDKMQNWINPDVILVTHLHLDHWDAPAAQILAKSLPVLCQPGDSGAFTEAGFTDIREIGESAEFGSVTLYRTGGQHGTGEIGARMGPVSGFVLQAEGEPALYIAGDTIWCAEVQEALDTFKPQVVVVNAGGARFTGSDPITMDAADVATVAVSAPGSRIVAVHMDAINHCLVTRELLREHLAVAGLLSRVDIPEDGQWIDLE
ncbi:MBL fold metallo-hydrolase [Paenibacillus sp. NFR01]|uniref:MBL fold metallo-hydrolase n=1 Tax=Paenibacillus sp. NFR01 TaxID=1566279 RepID=UPI0008D43772|nr:MBL fold metallo-hydrolase [Paenibacillus sp. NFR01]SET14797.1 L-ascorbate metabolism protein UlaG, beta-lactamase superfamily [Paenibacillus sp. NFR01]